MTAFPLLKMPVRSAVPPAMIVVGFASKLVMMGAAGAGVAPPPPPPQAMDHTRAPAITIWHASVRTRMWGLQIASSFFRWVGLVINIPQGVNQYQVYEPVQGCEIIKIIAETSCRGIPDGITTIHFPMWFGCAHWDTWTNIQAIDCRVIVGSHVGTYDLNMM
jgi:hypothetical protein